MTSPEYQSEFPFLNEEDRRQGELFAEADQLADNHEIQDKFLASLSHSDRSVIEDSLVVANALRLLSQEPTPPMSGRARARIQQALFGDLESTSDAGQQNLVGRNSKTIRTINGNPCHGNKDGNR